MKDSKLLQKIIEVHMREAYTQNKIHRCSRPYDIARKVMYYYNNQVQIRSMRLRTSKRNMHMVMSRISRWLKYNIPKEEEASVPDQLQDVKYSEEQKFYTKYSVPKTNGMNVSSCSVPNGIQQDSMETLLQEEMVNECILPDFDKISTTDMDIYYDSIKQEFISAEEYQINSYPCIDLTVPVKNEPILDEPLMPVMVKEGSVSEKQFTQGTVSNETVSEKQETVANNTKTSLQSKPSKFVIYDVHTPTVINTLSTLPRTTGGIQILKKLPTVAPQGQTTNMSKLANQSLLRTTSSIVTSNLKQIGMNNIKIKQIIVPTKSSSQSILLNSQLRKRQKVFLTINPDIDKKPRYNIIGTTPPLSSTNPPPPPPKPIDKISIGPVSKSYANSSRTSCGILNEGNKQNISVLTKNTSEQKRQDGLASRTLTANPCSTSNTSVRNAHTSTTYNRPIDTPTTNTQSPKSSIGKIPKISIDKSSKISIDTSSKISIDTSLKSSIDKSPKSSDEKFGADSSPSYSGTKNSPKSSSVNRPEIPELRVKCLCSLTTENTAADDSKLKEFFEEMFEETRHLSKAQQRKVKMVLLKAIFDAEELNEKGKCCGSI